MLQRRKLNIEPPPHRKAKPEPAPSAKKSRYTRASLGRLLANWNRVAKRAKSLPAGDRLVAWCLHDYALMGESVSTYLDTGKLQCWPSVERIADDIGVNRRTVQRALRRLEAAGLIRTQVARVGGNLTSHYYLLPQKRSSPEIPFEDTEPVISSTDRGGEETAFPDLIGAASEVEKGRSGRRPNTTPYGGKEYARGRRRDAAPLKGAAASHRRAKENINRRQPILDWDNLELIRTLDRKRDELPEKDFLILLEKARNRMSEKDYLALRDNEDFEDDDDDDLYDRLKRERDQLSKADFLALIEDHRSQLSAGEYRGLKNKA